jgi:tetratricopeptide (TPR) repeat protein
MHGPLQEIGLIEVLQLLARGRRTGVLHVSGPDPEQPHAVHLVDGTVVAIEPDAGDAAVRAALMQRHLLSARDADEGWSATPLANAMREQLAATALTTMLHWQRGRFDFAVTATSGPLGLAPERIILDLISRESRRVALARDTEDFHAVPDFAPLDQLAAGEPVDFTTHDWRLLDLTDGVRDVAALAAALDEPLETIAESVIKLRGAAILELHAPAVDPTLAARMAIEAGQYDRAAELLRARVTLQPEDWPAWRDLGLAEVGAGRFDQAIDAWQSWRAGDAEHAGDAALLMQAARTMLEALRDSRD